MSEKEKGISYTVDNGNSSELHTLDNLKPLPERGSQEWAVAEHNLVRKLDMRLLPTIFFIYIMNYIDVCVIIIFCILIPLTHVLTFPPINSAVALRLHG